MYLFNNLVIELMVSGLWMYVFGILFWMVFKFICDKGVWIIEVIIFVIFGKVLGRDLYNMIFFVFGIFFKDNFWKKLNFLVWCSF